MKKYVCVMVGTLALTILGSTAQAQTKPVTLKSIKLAVAKDTKIDTTFLGAAISERLKMQKVELDSAGIDLTIKVDEMNGGGLKLSGIAVGKNNGWLAVTVSQENILFYKQDVIARAVAKKLVDALQMQIKSGTWAKNMPPAEESARTIVTVVEAKK